MALRLTGIPTPDDAAGTPGDGSARPIGAGLKIAPVTDAVTPAPLAARSAGAFGAQLREQARLQLTISQLERYRALFARAAEQPDRHARYHARVLLLEEGLTAAGQTTSQTQAAHLFVAVATAALDAARGGPARAHPAQLRRRRPVRAVEPGRRACDCSRPPAASTPPSPTSSATSRSWAGAGKGHRPRTDRCTPPCRAWPHAPASWPPKAQPAKGMTLSLCMIVRDEEQMLATLPGRRRARGGRDHRRRHGVRAIATIEIARGRSGRR